MRKSIIKIVVFLLIIVSPIVVIKTIVKTNRGYNQANILLELSTADTSFVFIGSSRVKNSVDPEIIKSHYTNVHIVNLGISGGTFLSNCLMADMVLQQAGHKVLFIELSPLLEELPDGFYRFSSETGFSPGRSLLSLTESQSFSDRFMLISNVLNHYLYKSISVKDDVREIFQYKLDHDDNWIGYVSSDKNDFHSTSSFLTWQEINASASGSIDLSKYILMIRYLETLAKNNNSRIVFFLPLTYNKQAEKSIVIPLYHSLPDTMKLDFSAHFLKQMTRSEFLLDQNHFNRQGATAYSTLLIPLIREHYNL